MRYNRELPSDMNRETIKVYCDKPVDGAEFGPNTEIGLCGWAVTPAGIAFVDVRLDDQPPYRVPFGALRPDVDGAFPGMANAPFHGFEHAWRPWKAGIGRHKLIITAWSNQGENASVERAIHIRDVVKGAL